MFNHEPKNYECPFCILAKGKNTEKSNQEDIVFQTEDVIVLLAADWWINNPGHVFVFPRHHVENIYSISDSLIAKVYTVVKHAAIALRTTENCTGISTRQHNEPDGGQDIWHYHTHVVPRYKGDMLYKNTEKKRVATVKEKEKYRKLLKNYFKINN